MIESLCYVTALLLGLAVVRPMQQRPRKISTYEMLKRLPGATARSRSKSELVRLYKHR